MRRFARWVGLVTTLAGLPACLGRQVPVPGSLPAPTPAISTCGASPGALSLLDPDGSTCLPVARLSVWTCEQTGAAPFARRTVGGRVYRYLGGRFAVRVPALPATAEPVGSAGDVEVFADRSDPRRLWVRRAGAIARWLLLPDSPPGDPSTVSFIGDSIADGASVFFPMVLPAWDMSFDAVPGRGSAGGVAPAAMQAALGFDAVVVELGTNDLDVEAFTANMEEILRSLVDVPLVLWQTVKGPPVAVRQHDINRVIFQLAQSYPNVAVVDWARRVKEAQLSGDGVHPNAEHLDLMTTLVAPALDAWLAAARQRSNAEPCDSSTGASSVD